MAGCRMCVREWGGGGRYLICKCGLLNFMDETKAGALWYAGGRAWHLASNNWSRMATDDATSLNRILIASYSA